MNRKQFLLSMLATLILFGTGICAQGATLQIAGGKLVGATNITVGSSLYDVSFVDGTCVLLFSGCDSSSDFVFTTSSDAIAASNALLVLVP